MKNSRGANSNRQLKVSNLIAAELVNILQRGRQIDVRLIENMITVTKVTITSDLKIANCYFLPLTGSKITAQEFLDAFDISKNSIRKQITESINLKYSPEIRFTYDKGAENALDVDKVLKNIKL